ncbi:hypothetical protein [Arachidicoccus soli]|nr:hypothetical protein [Arachidicoccus soli]
MPSILPSNLELLKHIADEISFVLKATDGKDKDTVINDRLYRVLLYAALK